MPYALFCQDVKISKAYATEAEVWKHAVENGLVVDVASQEESPSPERILDNDYQIRRCKADTPDKTPQSANTDFKLPFPA